MLPYSTRLVGTAIVFAAAAVVSISGQSSLSLHTHHYYLKGAKDGNEDVATRTEGELNAGADANTGKYDQVHDEATGRYLTYPWVQNLNSHHYLKGAKVGNEDVATMTEVDLNADADADKYNQVHDEATRRYLTYLRHNIIAALEDESEETSDEEVQRSLWVAPSNTPSTQWCHDPLPPPPLPGKKGIGFTMRDEGQLGSWVENLPKILALNVSWNYGWNSQRREEQPNHIEFLPMLWGGKWLNDLENRIANHVVPQYQANLTKRLLSFNEPDIRQQSDMTVQQVIDVWPLLEATGMPLASPSVGHGEGQWMIHFMEQTETECLRMEYVAIHWYGGAVANSFKKALWSTYQRYGSKRPLLITEFAPADWLANSQEENRWSRDQVLSFMKSVLPWLEQQDWVAGYAWFPFNADSPYGTSSALFDLDGNINELGKYYASV